MTDTPPPKTSQVIHLASPAVQRMKAIREAARRAIAGDERPLVLLSDDEHHVLVVSVDGSANLALTKDQALALGRDLLRMAVLAVRCSTETP